MRVFIAGASGVIGQPLVDLLVEEGHEVYGMTQSKDRALVMAAKGAKPILLNVLEREAVLAAVRAMKPDVVIDMLTRLPKEYTPESMRQAAGLDAKIRIEGGAHLQEAAEACGTQRYIVQSSGFWYAPGAGLAEEDASFAFEASPGIASGTRLYADIEQRVLESEKIEGVALRFGFFYGPGTWFHPDGNVAEQIRKKQFPLIGRGEGIWNFVHIEDAARAVKSAIYSSPGAYNVVNNHPAAMRDWLPAFAHYIGAEHPLSITEEEGLKERGADAVYYATKLRGASNAKAKREFNFQPRTFEWFL